MCQKCGTAIWTEWMTMNVSQQQLNDCASIVGLMQNQTEAGRIIKTGEFKEMVELSWLVNCWCGQSSGDHKSQGGNWKSHSWACVVYYCFYFWLLEMFKCHAQMSF
jgi:hypothetical protein